jgi:hypothetical protein
MATTGTYEFNPSLGEITLYAFQNIGVRPTALLQEHMESARMAANMMLSRWSNQGVNLWAVDLVTVPLIEGVAEYAVDPNTVVMLDVYGRYVSGRASYITTAASCVGTTATITFAGTFEALVGSIVTVSGVTPEGYNGSWVVTASTSGVTSTVSFTVPSALGALTIPGSVEVSSSTSPPIDRPIMPISRSEYASYSTKTTQGAPTVYWFDRLISPKFTLWPVPDGQTLTSIRYYRVRRIQDAAMANNTQVEVPYLWLEAFADGLAYRLARIWNPQIAVALKAQADESYQIAADQNIETSNVYISPLIGGYFR